MRTHSLLSIPAVLLSFFIVAGLLAPQAVQARGKTLSQTAVPATSGRVTVTLGHGGFLIGGSGGKGTLVYHGRTYAFEMGGIGFGEFGGSKATCQGEVRNLHQLEDFSGAYVQFEGGATGVKGSGEFWLKNTKGVEIRLRSRTKGFDLTAEAEGVMIKLKEAKKK